LFDGNGFFNHNNWLIGVAQALPVASALGPPLVTIFNPNIA
jgi:hypothetical protein